MPRQQHYYGFNHAHFLTASTYRRARLFDSDRFRLHFVRTLRELRERQGFRIFGWVLMPEHFHLLLWPSDRANPSQIVQSLKERTAKFALFHLRKNAAYPWCAKTLEKLTLPPSVKRGLVATPDLWPWSSFRFYHLRDASLLKIDPPP